MESLQKRSYLLGAMAVSAALAAWLYSSKEKDETISETIAKANPFKRMDISLRFGKKKVGPLTRKIRAKKVKIQRLKAKLLVTTDSAKKADIQARIERLESDLSAMKIARTAKVRQSKLSKMDAAVRPDGSKPAQLMTSTVPAAVTAATAPAIEQQPGVQAGSVSDFEAQLLAIAQNATARS